MLSHITSSGLLLLYRCTCVREDTKENVQEHTWTNVYTMLRQVDDMRSKQVRILWYMENSFATCKVFLGFPCCNVWYHIHFPYSTTPAAALSASGDWGRLEPSNLHRTVIPSDTTVNYEPTISMYILFRIKLHLHPCSRVVWRGTTRQLLVLFFFQRPRYSNFGGQRFEAIEECLHMWLQMNHSMLQLPNPDPWTIPGVLWSFRSLFESMFKGLYLTGFRALAVSQLTKPTPVQIFITILDRSIGHGSTRLYDHLRDLPAGLQLELFEHLHATLIPKQTNHKTSVVRLRISAGPDLLHVAVSPSFGDQKKWVTKRERNAHFASESLPKTVFPCAQLPIVTYTIRRPSARTCCNHAFIFLGNPSQTHLEWKRRRQQHKHQMWRSSSSPSSSWFRPSSWTQSSYASSSSSSSSSPPPPPPSSLSSFCFFSDFSFSFSCFSLCFSLPTSPSVALLIVLF